MGKSRIDKTISQSRVSESFTQMPATCQRSNLGSSERHAIVLQTPVFVLVAWWCRAHHTQRSDNNMRRNSVVFSCRPKESKLGAWSCRPDDNFWLLKKSSRDRVDRVLIGIRQNKTFIPTTTLDPYTIISWSLLKRLPTRSLLHCTGVFVTVKKYRVVRPIDADYPDHLLDRVDLIGSGNLA